jgi:hypothetical protein
MTPMTILATASVATDSPLFSGAILGVTLALVAGVIGVFAAAIRSARTASRLEYQGDSRPDDCMI